MTPLAHPASVEAAHDHIRVRYPSALDDSLTTETIIISDIRNVVLERTSNGVLHWFLTHRDGWTLHFSDDFLGASEVIAYLKRSFGFVVPDLPGIAGPGQDGTVVWSKEGGS